MILRQNPVGCLLHIKLMSAVENIQKYAGGRIFFHNRIEQRDAVRNGNDRIVLSVKDLQVGFGNGVNVADGERFASSAASVPQQASTRAPYLGFSTDHFARSVIETNAPIALKYSGQNPAIISDI